MQSKSLVKAIIKRGITDYELFFSSDMATKYSGLYKGGRKISLDKSWKSNVRLWKEAYHFSLIQIIHNKFRNTNNENVIFCYLDLDQILDNRERISSSYYPTEYQLCMHLIERKSFIKQLKSNEDPSEPSVSRVAIITTHCIERIIERSRSDRFIDAIKLFSPICTCLINIRMSINKDLNLEKRYILYWKAGYLVIGLDPNLFIPVIITWIPKKWFSKPQHNRFIDFEKFSSMVFIFEENIQDTEMKYQECDVFWSFDIDQQGEELKISVDDFSNFL